MAAYAACKRVGINPIPGKGIIENWALLRGGLIASSTPPSIRFDRRQISELVKPNGKRLFLVDTLALVRRLEAQGVPSKQAEAITAAITEVLNDSLENVAQSVVSNGEMQKIVMIQESKLSKFKSEVQNSQILVEIEMMDDSRALRWMRTGII